MTTHDKPPASPSTAEAPATPDSGLDEQLHGFWKNNGPALLIFCGLLLVGYLGKMGWEYYSEQREASTEEEFSSAITSEGWRAFAEAHPDHPLAGVAEMHLADAAYASNRMDTAITAYAKALDTLKPSPLAARARLGLAMAKVQAGQMTDGESMLHQLAEDPGQYKSVRAEATYQLASLAAAAGLAADVRKFSTQLMQIDPNSPWTQRAFALQAEEAAPAPPPGVGGGISFRPGSTH